MRIFKITCMSLVLLSACAPTLRYAAHATEITAQVSLACDEWDTRQALHSGQFGETNPILGEFPSDGTLAAYFGATSGATFTANRLVSYGFRHHEEVGSIVRILMNSSILGVEYYAMFYGRDPRMQDHPCGL